MANFIGLKLSVARLKNSNISFVKNIFYKMFHKMTF